MIKKITLPVKFTYHWILPMLTGLLILLPSRNSAQVTLDGDFEYIAYDSTPAPWYLSKQEHYHVFTDSTDFFKGIKSLYIQPTPGCKPYSSQLIFQTLPLSFFAVHRQAEMRYKMKVNKGIPDCLNAYVAQFTCPVRSGGIQNLKAKVDTIGWGGRFKTGNWINYTISVQLNEKDTCSELYFGFVVKGITDMNVDAMELYIDGKKVNDLPLVLQPLPDEKDINWLKKQVVEIKPDSNADHSNDLSFLKRTIGEAQVVAFGEATHGTHEFFTLHNLMVKYLVEQMGFEVIVFENDMLTTQKINRPEELQKPGTEIAGNSFNNVHQTKEMGDLFEYIKAYNRSPNKKIYIEGVDNQYPNYVLDELYRQLVQIDTTLADVIKETDGKRWLANKNRKSFVDSLYNSSIQLQHLFSERKDFIAQRVRDTSLLMRLQENISLLKDAIFFAGIDSRKLNMYRTGSDCRDSLMAGNLLWLQQFYRNKKIIVLNHNEHINKAVKESFYSGNMKNMGTFLFDKLHDNYKSFGVATATGKAVFYSYSGKPEVKELEAPVKNSYEYYLNKTGKSFLFWNFPKGSSTINKHVLLLRKLRLRSMGWMFFNKQFYESNMVDMFDGLFFIRQTTPAQSLYPEK